MKFSERTLTILKSFSTINKSILIKEGNVLKTVTPEKTLIASAIIGDQIPSQACVYDLSRFLSILGLYKDPDVEFHDKYFMIRDGKQRTKYVYADVSMIHAAPEKIRFEANLSHEVPDLTTIFITFEPAQIPPWEIIDK